MPSDIVPQGAGSGLDADRLDGAQLGDIQAEIDGDIAVHASSPDHDSRYVNVTGDNMSGGLGTPQVNLGNVGQSGRLELYQNGTSSAILIADNYALTGAFLSLYDDMGSNLIDLYPDPQGRAGQFDVLSQFGYFEIDGNYAGTGDPRMSLTGTNSTSVFDTHSSGTDAVQLPDDAVDSSEILDEPGIASANTSASVTFNAAMQDIETVTITTPAAGYIVVEGKCIGREYNTTGAAQGWVQIDETAGGSTVPPHAVFFGLASHASTAGYNAFPVYVSRVYNKGTAGTYTFRMEGIQLAEGQEIVLAREKALALRIAAKVAVVTTFGDVASGIVGRMETVGKSVVTSLDGLEATRGVDLSGVDHFTMDALKTMLDNASSGGGSSGGGCACACAGCACACACAGGGR